MFHVHRPTHAPPQQKKPCTHTLPLMHKNGTTKPLLGNPQSFYSPFLWPAFTVSKSICTERPVRLQHIKEWRPWGEYKSSSCTRTGWQSTISKKRGEQMRTTGQMKGFCDTAWFKVQDKHGLAPHAVSLDHSEPTVLWGGLTKKCRKWKEFQFSW